MGTKKCHSNFEAFWAGFPKERPKYLKKNAHILPVLQVEINKKTVTIMHIGNVAKI